MHLPLATPDNLERLKRLCVAAVAVSIVVAIATAPSVFEHLILLFAATSILIGAAIASVSVWRRNRGAAYRDNDVTPRKPLPLFGPDMLILHRVHLGAHPIGGVLALGLAIYLWLALPESRLFILLSLVAGGLLGLAHWLRRS